MFLRGLVHGLECNLVAQGFQPLVQVARQALGLAPDRQDLCRERFPSGLMKRTL